MCFCFLSPQSCRGPQVEEKNKGLSVHVCLDSRLCTSLISTMWGMPLRPRLAVTLKHSCCLLGEESTTDWRFTHQTFEDDDTLPGFQGQLSLWHLTIAKAKFQSESFKDQEKFVCTVFFFHAINDYEVKTMWVKFQFVWGFEPHEGQEDTMTSYNYNMFYVTH